MALTGKKVEERMKMALLRAEARRKPVENAKPIEVVYHCTINYDTALDPALTDEEVAVTVVRSEGFIRDVAYITRLFEKLYYPRGLCLIYRIN